MKKLTIGVLVLSLLVTFSIVGFAADDTASHGITVDLSEFVLVGLNDSSDITFTVDTSTSSAGELPTSLTNTDKRLYYLAFIASGDTTTIDAGITSGTIPSSYSISVEATVGSATVGTPGSSAGEVTLGSATANNIITGIGPVATGTTASDAGAGLTYTLSFNDVPDPTASDVYTVTYTITDTV